MRRFVISCLVVLLGVFWEDGQMRAQRTLPVGEVRIGRKGEVLATDRVPIWSFGDLYSALGMTSQRFSAWEGQYGMDSLGIGDGGELLIPGFPVFSKVAWTYIDPVDLTDSETAELVEECARAATLTGRRDLQDTFRNIHDLAQRAIEQSANVRFGPPYSSGSR